MEFRILGSLEISNGDGPVDVGPRKQRLLLALLMIHANRVVTTDRIIEELWGDDSEGKEKALWVYISRLRSSLGEAEILVTRDHGYSLLVDDDRLDARRFESAVAEGQALIKDDPSAASNKFTEGLDLWRGAALEEFAYEEFAQSEMRRLEELRLVALEERAEADLRRGQTREIIADLEALREAHPTRERLVSHLMLALYRAGRQRDALRAFESFRSHVAELGLDPSPELRLLEEQILLHDSRIQGRTRVDAANAPLLSAGQANPFIGLRAFYEDDSDRFFGRARVIADVVRRLDDGTRLIGLVGPSGSGKSSIARAGLVPALRKGAIPGSDDWLIAEMVPGSHPFAELEAALLRSSLDTPDSLSEQLADREAGVLRAVLRVLPSENARLVLVIDQFEELFT
ncbi:MAG: BTAD domain-containing putative transcriptional regulator, partial [Acidimicrobiales bacterium]